MLCCRKSFRGGFQTQEDPQTWLEGIWPRSVSGCGNVYVYADGYVYVSAWVSVYVSVHVYVHVYVCVPLSFCPQVFFLRQCFSFYDLQQTASCQIDFISPKKTHKKQQWMFRTSFCTFTQASIEMPIHLEAPNRAFCVNVRQHKSNHLFIGRTIWLFSYRNQLLLNH